MRGDVIVVVVVVVVVFVVVFVVVVVVVVVFVVVVVVVVVLGVVVVEIICLIDLSKVILPSTSPFMEWNCCVASPKLTANAPKMGHPKRK